MGPNTYYVTKYEAADDNASIEGSLRWALAQAKNDATTATPAHIVFDEVLRGKTVYLQSDLSSFNDSSTWFNKSLVMTGLYDANGMADVTIAGGSDASHLMWYRGLIFTGNGSVKISGINFDSFISWEASEDLGAAIATWDSQGMTLNVERSTFSNNFAEGGGAMYVGWNTSLTMDRAVFQNNRVETYAMASYWAGGKGGALYVDGAATITNTVFERNQSWGTIELPVPYGGGAIYSSSDSTLLSVINSTFVHNLAEFTNSYMGGGGNAIFNENFGGNSFVSYNNIFYDTRAAASNAVKTNFSRSGSNYYSPTGSSLPQIFVDENNHDFHLIAAASPINRGTNTPAVGVLPSTDMDGNIRKVGINVDAGAYEYNAPPTVSAPVPDTVTTDEDTAATIPAITVADTDNGDTLTATVTLDDPAHGTLGSIAGNYDNATGVWTVTGAVADVNAALAALSFTPAPNYNGTAAIGIRVRDASNTGPGDGSITFNITPVNDAPTGLALSAAIINQSAGANAAVGTLSTTDADQGDTFTYALVAGDGTNDSGNAFFNISGNSLRATNAGQLAPGSHNVFLKTTDAGGASYTKAFVINVLDDMPPAVSQVSAPANDTYIIGQHLDFTVIFDSNVTVTGTGSTLGLTIGGNVRQATYLDKTANSVTYRYTVQAGDNDHDGIAVGDLTLHGTTICDDSGNDATLSLIGHVPSTTGLLVDTTAPSITGTIGVPANDSYKSGQTLSFTITFDESISVIGDNSTLWLSIGGVTRQAAFASKTGNSITYRYTVMDGETDTNGIEVGAITLNSTTIRDAVGNDANLSLAGHLPSTANVLVDTTAPTVSGISSDTPDGTYKTGDVISVKVTFDDVVTVTGMPRLTLETGTTDRAVNYTSGSNTNTLVFNYTVQAGDSSAELDYLSSNALSLNGGMIVDAAGNQAALILPAPGSASSLGGNRNIVIDAVPPAVPTMLSLALSADTGVSDGRYTSTPRPTITGSAEAGSTVTLYDTDGSTSLGQATAAGDGIWSITTDTDLSPGNHALTAKASDAPGNVSAASAAVTVTIDTTAPQVTAAAVNGATLTLSFTESVYAANADGMAVTVNGTARTIASVAGSGTATLTLTLASAVESGQTVAFDYDPTATASDLADAAGHEMAALVAHAVTNATAAPDSPPSDPVPPPANTTVDGVPVQTQNVTNADGSTSQVLTIPIVTGNRVESVGNNAVADIPLVTSGAGTGALTAQVPAGFGLMVSGTVTSQNAGASVTDLIREINAHTEAGSNDRAVLTGGVSGFLQELPANTPMLVQTLTPIVASNTAVPAAPLVITGAPAAPGAPMTALVINAQGLPPDAGIELQHVDFAAIIGNAHVTGGAGSQHVWGDSGSQYIVLGADDDELHGGAGDDTVGSEGGNDRLFGDDGNDTMFGGSGQNLIAGGAGNDTVTYTGNRADYKIERNGKIVTVRSLSTPTDADTLVNVETIKFGDATVTLADDYSSATTAQVLTGLYASIYGRAPDSAGLQYWIHQVDEAGTSLHQVATQFSQVAKFDQLYAPTLSTADFVARIYKNILGIEGDAAGRAFWAQKIDNGLSRTDFVGDFVFAALKFNPATSTATGADLTNATLAKDTLANKVQVGLHYAAALADKSNGAVDSAAYQQSIDVLNGVDVTSESIENAVVKIDLIGGHTGFGSAVAQEAVFA
ncbi:DUF4214 domain-containing protein [Herbaspirillum sp. HC18]|nr:DUF4214 domain-containing protein [Herbaspirillum sp. HC18]